VVRASMPTPAGDVLALNMMDCPKTERVGTGRSW
jgi:hypothetical protein